MSSFMQLTELTAPVAVALEIAAEVSQEISALVLFAITYCCFRYFNIRRAKAKQAFPKPQKQVVFSLPGKNAGDSVGQQRIAEEAEANLIALLNAREFTTALNAYRNYEREGLDRFFRNEAMYSRFIQTAVRVNKIDVVDRMLRLMDRNQVEPSLDFWHATLKMMSSRKHYSSCLLVFTSYAHMLPNDKVIFSCIINAALESGEPAKAPPMLERYQQCSLDASDYVTAFRIHVAMGDADAAEKLFFEMEAPTPIMLNLALLACVNAKQPQRAMSLLQKTHQMETTASMRLVDSISYNTVIKGFVARGFIDDCLSCLESMQKHGLKADDVTLTSLLDISLRDKTGGMTDRLVEMLLQSNRSLDIGTCNTFIKGLLKKHEHGTQLTASLHTALQIYEHMKNIHQSPRPGTIAHGSRPTIVTYSLLIKASVEAQDLERALHLVEDMASAGLSPDEKIFTTLLDGCRLIGNHELGERLFEDMLAAGVRPSEFTLTMMVKLRGKCGAHATAYELVEGWEAKHGLKPSVIHYTCLMSGCLQRKSYGQAWAAYQLMEKNGIAADEMLMTTLLPAMATSGAFDRVVHLARCALKRPGGIKVPTSTWKSMLAQMLLAKGAEKQAEEMKVLMQVSGIAVTDTVDKLPGKATAVPPWRASRAQ